MGVALVGLPALGRDPLPGPPVELGETRVPRHLGVDPGEVDPLGLRQGQGEDLGAADDEDLLLAGRRGQCLTIA